MSTPKLGRKKEHRERTVRNLATSLVLYERIRTTEAKADAVVPLLERLITKARTNTLAARRAAKEVLFDTNAVSKLFEDLTMRQGTRTSGFLRVTKLPPRPGDGAPMAQVEFLLTPLEDVLQAESNTKVRVRKAATTTVSEETAS
jgi:large subunit ribosomal protein L17